MADDATLRNLQLAGAKAPDDAHLQAQNVVNRLRCGEITELMVSIAASYGDPVARIVLPSIKIRDDILKVIEDESDYRGAYLLDMSMLSAQAIWQHNCFCIFSMCQMALVHHLVETKILKLDPRRQVPPALVTAMRDNNFARLMTLLRQRPYNPLGEAVGALQSIYDRGSESKSLTSELVKRCFMALRIAASDVSHDMREAEAVWQHKLLIDVLLGAVVPKLL